MYDKYNARYNNRKYLALQQAAHEFFPRPDDHNEFMNRVIDAALEISGVKHRCFQGATIHAATLAYLEGSESFCHQVDQYLGLFR